MQVYPSTLVSTAYPTRNVRLSLEKSLPSEGKSDDGPSRENLQSQKNVGVEHLKQMHSEPRRWNHPLDRSTRTKAANRRLYNRETDSYVHPNASAHQSNKKAADFSTAVFTWSGQRDSNPRPSPWQGDALPAEPCPHLKWWALQDLNL